MNKKIKIIDLIDKIYHKNNVPKRIKYKNKIWLYDNVEERYCLEDSFVSLAFETDRLTDEVEILEDNTEEIEEKSNFEDMGYEIAQAYFEFYKGIAKALTEKRKESEDK